MVNWSRKLWHNYFITDEPEYLIETEYLKITTSLSNLHMYLPLIDSSGAKVTLIESKERN